MIQKWETVSYSEIEDLFIFSAKKAKRINPISGEIGEYTIINSNDWANVIPITKDGEIIMVEQYRQGNGNITLEVPGGLLEDGEEPAKAAIRELLEETGYSSKKNPILIGKQSPNPAFMNNYCYTFLIEDCELLNEQNLDKDEIIEIHKFNKKEVKNMILNGKIDHGVILTAFYFYSLYSGF